MIHVVSAVFERLLRATGSGWPPRWPAILIALCLVSTAWAVTHLPPGSTAPVIKLNDLQGHEIDTSKPLGRPIILLFGEVYHGKTQQADQLIDKVLARPVFADQSIATYLVVTQKVSAVDLQEAADKARIHATILMDTQRTTFESYRVAVMPSVVVIDTQGKVVHAIAALTDRFEDVLTDSLLLATGKLSPEQFRLRLKAQAEPEDPDTLRAKRLTQLADQLTRRELGELAEEKYKEAMRVKPDYIPARLGLGLLELQRQRWAQAEIAFKAVLKDHPDSTQAVLGLAYIQILRGDKELDTAETLLKKLINQNLQLPRAHYLLGLIHEKKGRIDQAAASYKKAAELLLDQAE